MADEELHATQLDEEELENGHHHVHLHHHDHLNDENDSSQRHLAFHPTSPTAALVLAAGAEEQMDFQPDFNFWDDNGVFSHLSPDYRNDPAVQHEYMVEFWKTQKTRIQQTVISPTHILFPPKRVRRIVRRDEDVHV